MNHLYIYMYRFNTCTYTCIYMYLDNSFRAGRVVGIHKDVQRVQHSTK